MNILKSIWQFIRNVWSAIVAGGFVIILVLTLAVGMMVKMVIDLFELTFAFTVTLAVLLCFEDIRKPDQWCHRRIFAQWWEEKTGQEITELTERDPVHLTARERRLRDEKLYNGYLF